MFETEDSHIFTFDENSESLFIAILCLHNHPLLIPASYFTCHLKLELLPEQYMNFCSVLKFWTSYDSIAVSYSGKLNSLPSFLATLFLSDHHHHYPDSIYRL